MAFSDPADVKNIVSTELTQLAIETKNSLKEVQKVAITQAWKILQLTVATTIQIIEKNSQNIVGKDKKIIALDCISKFYDSVFIIIDVPFIPNIIEGIAKTYIKSFLMILIGSSIDAMVTTFRQIGVFQTKESVASNVNSMSSKPKSKTKRKKK